MSDDSPPPGDRGGDEDHAGGDSDRDDGSDSETGERTILGVRVTDRLLVAGGVAVAALLLLYSVLIAQQVFLWVAAVGPFLFLYLFWRLVRAHERLADAQERRADTRE